VALAIRTLVPNARPTMPGAAPAPVAG
jgi:hypothetical protein